MIFSDSSGSVLIGTSPITSTLPALSKSSTSAFAFGVATRTSSLGSTSSLPNVITSFEVLTTIFWTSFTLRPIKSSTKPTIPPASMINETIKMGVF